MADMTTMDAMELVRNHLEAAGENQLASWQRCRTHFMRNLLVRVPKSAQGMVATLVRGIFAQSDEQSTWAAHGNVVQQLEKRFPDAAKLLDQAAGELLAFTAFPKAHWKQIWSNIRRSG
jgi:transposase-like protein